MDDAMSSTTIWALILMPLLAAHGYFAFVRLASEGHNIGAVVIAVIVGIGLALMFLVAAGLASGSAGLGIGNTSIQNLRSESGHFLTNSMKG